MKRVLVLGAGLVVKPLLDELLSRPDIEVHVATINVDRARHLIQDRPRATALLVNATDQESLRVEVQEADVVISLLPANQHILIADACLEHGRPLITTSYIAESLRALDPLARQKGVLVLGECGLDPGIDHMTAAAEVRRLEALGGAIVRFASYCGGLPAPSANTNPWGYKFTWSPRGVVVATRNQVRYLQDGRIVSQHFPEYFAEPRHIEVPGMGRLESYPNRDCLKYIDAYGLGWRVDNFFRGTLRYPGWCATWYALHRLGLLAPSRIPSDDATYADLVADFVPPGPGPLRSRVATKLGLEDSDPILDRFAWLGLFSDEPVPAEAISVLDLLVTRLEQKLGYDPGEHDVVVLEHQIDYRTRDDVLHRRVLRMVLEGTAGDDSAMARTVSLPAALACELIIDEQVSLTGVQIPTAPDLAEPILRGLERRGIRFEETDEALPVA